jgi:CRP-like cAMP-binding protein
MTLIHYKPNDVIVRQGDPGDSFFYILTGIVKIVVSKKYDLGLDNEQSKVTVEKYIGDLKSGQTFGELSLIYGTPRSATIIAVTNSSLIKLDKSSFDMYVKDIFENQLKDQIEFMKICPIFHRVSKEMLIKLAIRTERKKFITNQVIINNKTKSEFLYIIRRGSVKVIKNIDFIKDENKMKKQIQRKSMSSNSYEDMKIIKEINEEKMLEALSQGPTNEDYEKSNVQTRSITLETLKMGDLFPSYHCVNSLTLDVSYEAESPCDLIILKLSDLQETIIVNPNFLFILGSFQIYPNLCKTLSK